VEINYTLRNEREGKAQEVNRVEMSSAVSQATSSTPILVTTTSTDTTKPFNEHKRDDSSDDQRQQLNKQLTKTYTRVSLTIDSLSLCRANNLCMLT
jgi:hypothetical protein